MCNNYSLFTEEFILEKKYNGASEKKRSTETEKKKKKYVL